MIQQKLCNRIGQLYKSTGCGNRLIQEKETMTTINFIIPNMVTPYGQMEVVDLIMFAGGTVKNIVPTIAEVELSNYLMKEEVVKAIERAGYDVELTSE